MKGDIVVRHLTILVVLVFALGLGPWVDQGRTALAESSRPAAVAQSDAEIAAATAILLSQFEASGDFQALYDWIHPDAHAVASRTAVIGWFQNEYFPRGPGVITVTGVRFVSWTWEVTGQTYPNTAEVSFEQPFFNEGQTITDVVRLVPFEGTYRWFFGRSAEFVNQVNATYGQVYQPPPTNATLDSYVRFVYDDLNTFWSDQFAAGGLPYRAPNLQRTSGYVSTACGDGPSDFSYCPLDETIYLDIELADVFLSNIEFSLAYVVAHEFSHHIQFLSTGAMAQRLPIEVELEADCLAGVWSLDIDTRGMLEANDIGEVVTLIDVIGDQRGTSVFDARAHGSSSQRTASYLSGFYDGFHGCSLELM